MYDDINFNKYGFYKQRELYGKSSFDSFKVPDSIPPNGKRLLSGLCESSPKMCIIVFVNHLRHHVVLHIFLDIFINFFILLIEVCYSVHLGPKYHWAQNQD
jgi:hypothetical protein